MCSALADSHQACYPLLSWSLAYYIDCLLLISKDILPLPIPYLDVNWWKIVRGVMNCYEMLNHKADVDEMWCRLNLWINIMVFKPFVFRLMNSQTPNYPRWSPLLPSSRGPKVQTHYKWCPEWGNLELFKCFAGRPTSDEQNRVSSDRNSVDRCVNFK